MPKPFERNISLRMVLPGDNRPMHRLRSSSILARLVLAWFVLTLGVAVASPIVHPQAMEIVCSTANTVKLVVVGEDDAATGMEHHTLDCSLCLNVATNVPREPQTAVHQQPLAHALKPVVAARMAALVGAPLPPRGPPALVS